MSNKLKVKIGKNKKKNTENLQIPKQQVMTINPLTEEMQQGEAQDLKYRIYNLGFQIDTMPSVKRPQTAAILTRPLSAKVHGMKTHQAKKFQKQSTVLHGMSSKHFPQLQQQQQSPQQQLQTQNFVFNDNLDNEEQDEKIEQLQQQFNQQKNTQKYQQNQINKPLGSVARPMTAVQPALKQKIQFQQQLPPQQRIQSGMAQFTRNQMLSTQNQNNQLQQQQQQFFVGEEQQQQQQQNFQMPNKKKQVPYSASLAQFQQLQQQTLDFDAMNRPQTALIQSQKQLQNMINALGQSQLNDLYQQFGNEIPRILSAKSQFSQTELRQTKFLINKISGKFNIDKRYLTKTGQVRDNESLKVIKSAQQQPLLQSILELQRIMQDEQDQSQTKKQKEILKTTQQNININNLSNLPPQVPDIIPKQKPHENIKRPVTRLDKYIDLILKNVTNIDEFIYLKSFSNSDPYDLTVINYSDMKNDPQTQNNYYTISKKGLCHYINGKPVEFTNLAYWIKEREMYDQIKNLEFFKKFPKWKILNMWKKNVIRHKTRNSRMALEEKLFLLNPILGDTLMKHRRQCCEMQDLRFIELTNQQQFNLQNEVPTLEIFKGQQESRRRQVQDKIKDVSARCRENVREGFKQCLNNLRKNQYKKAWEDDFARRNNNQNFFRVKETTYEALGFPDNLSYEKRSELRKECSKFIRFSYLIDFLALESLHSIYIRSGEELMDNFETLLKIQQTFVTFEKDQQIDVKGKKDPCFSVKLEFQILDNIKVEDKETEMINEYVPEPLGHSTLEEFNPLYHVYLRQRKEEKEEEKEESSEEDIYVNKTALQYQQTKKIEEEESEDNYDQLDEFKQYQRLVIPKLYKKWLRIKPDNNTIFNDIIQCLVEGMNCLQSFERWAGHEDMDIYTKVLEEWDDKVGGDDQKQENGYLNPQTWEKQIPLHKYSDKVRSILDRAFSVADVELQKLNKFLMVYWENSQLDLSIFQNEELVRPTENLSYTLQSFTRQIELLKSEIPYMADINLLRIDFSETKNQIIPQPQQLINDLKQFLPQVMKERNQALKKWAFESYQQLQKITATVEDFVKQQNALKDITLQLDSVKNKISILGGQYEILHEFAFEIPKEDLSSYADTLQQQNSLTNQISIVEEKSEKQQELFGTQIKKDLIPQLEKLTIELEEQVNDQKFFMLDTKQEDAIIELRKLDIQTKEVEEKAKKYSSYEETLNLDKTNFENVDNLRLYLNLRLDMWASLKEWRELQAKWIDGKFKEIDTGEIRQNAEKYKKIINKCSKFLIKNDVLDSLKKMVFDFSDTIPVVSALTNKNLQAHHLEQIYEQIGQKFQIEEVTLKDLLAMNVYKCMKEIQEISTSANQEAELQKQYDEIEQKWTKLEFSIASYKSASAASKDSLYVLTEIDQLYETIDEYIVSLNNILGSRYLKFLRPKAENLLKKINNTQDLIDDWVTCQKNWIYLENIFQSQDIKKRLPVESGLFQLVDKFYKERMRKTKATPKVEKCYQQQLVKDLKKHKEHLNQIQTALEEYLESKRTQFPRFYFISNDELLEIFAKANDIASVQKHMKKLFDNIYKLYMGDDPKSSYIHGIVSSEGEIVEYSNKVNIRQEIEVWLQNLQEFMIQTLRRKMRQARIESYEIERKLWVMNPHPAQVTTTVAQINWAQSTEYQILEVNDNPNALIDWYNQNQAQLQELTELVRSKLNFIKHRVIVALITQDVHARDIIETLAENQVNTTDDFLWQQQLRLSWDEGIDDVLARQVQAELKYGYEFLGASTRLVITPLTDRCWMTITSALHLKLGANPAGPAGTGKTESTKDLAKVLGMFCIVFNCSEQIEYRLMSKLFSGLAQQGAWSCLDEFNRIDVEVLSVIAQQLLTIRQALLKGDKEFLFVDQKITLNPNIGVFITMNPGYAGRTELPDNLKILFRPVAMMIPDYAYIAEIMLFAQGFENAKNLSSKMVQLYKLSSEQLSQQKHYDFGMRAVKSVLEMAGELKKNDPTKKENEILITAMRDANIPKFLQEDLPLFQALIQDLFPDFEIPEVHYEELYGAIDTCSQLMGYQENKEQKIKITQLFETFNVRFGVMLVGEACSGKTACYTLLAQAMTALRKANSKDVRFQQIQTHFLNPKCISMDELYGSVDINTQEWHDGLASKILREVTIDESELRQWVIFDGPVDSLWIENMNTVLDDSRMLCLANGQRIKLKNEMKIIFEVQDLLVASPATVSRCGMVYFCKENLGWKSYVESWIQNKIEIAKSENQQPLLQPELLAHLKQLFYDNIDAGLVAVRKLNEPIQTVDLQLVISLCNLLETFLLSKDCGIYKLSKLDNKKRFMNYMYGYSYVWTMGLTIYEKYHDKFDTFMRNQFSNIVFPNTDNVYGFFLDFEKVDLDMEMWIDKLEQFEYYKDMPYFNMIIPTVDSHRYMYFVEILLTAGKNVFVTGSTSTGKSVILKQLLQKIQAPKFIDPIYFIFSSQTNSNTTQLTIENSLSKRSKYSIGAMSGRHAIMFIDDISMPAVETFGAQPPIELLRLMIDKNGFYDRKEHSWISVVDTSFLACAAQPGGGRNEISLRFTKHFNMICYPQPSEMTLRQIFNKIIISFLAENKFEESVKIMAEDITSSTVDVFYLLLKEKLPIPSKYHYTFNLRDISKVFQGLLMSKKQIIREPQQMVKLWIHEVQRVFQDRLINDEDRLWFEDLIINLIGRNFRSRLTKDDIFGQKNILFSDFLSKSDTDKEYQEIKDIRSIQKFLDLKIEDYNSQFTNKMKLIFFDDAIKHILRLARVLRQPRGNMMLIGVGGSGKQSLTKLTSYIMSYEIKQVEVSKNFNQQNFQDFLKDLLEECGLQGKKATFLFTDTQIVNEKFLEDINNLLNQGEVPNIWDQEKERLDKIINDLRPIHVNQLKRINQLDLIYQTFVERVRDNLHIILCMSPVGDALRIRCRKFPSIVDCCTLDWFQEWPDEALSQVAKYILEDFDLENSQTKAAIAYMCQIVYKNVSEQAINFDQQLKRKVYNTPKSFLDSINLYIHVLTHKREEVTTYLQRLQTGITTLEQANKDVAIMQIQLKELQPQLELQSIKVKEKLEVVEQKSIIAQEKQVIVEKEEFEINNQAQQIRLIADEADFELQQVEPLLKEAKELVEHIDKQSLIEMRTYKVPLKQVELVMNGVCILFNKKYEWSQVKLMMQDLNVFIQSLVTFKKDQISDQTLEKLKKHVANKDFDPKIVGKAALAAQDLCKWCLAMKNYADVSRAIAPKRKKAEEMQEKLEAKNKILVAKQDELNIVKAEVDKLKKESEEMQKVKQQLQETIQLTEDRLIRASKLITLLADEGKRWEVSIKNVEYEQINLIGDCFLASSCISFLGPFVGSFRLYMQNYWIEEILKFNLTVSDNFSFIKTLGDPLELREWMNNGLPSDVLSQENALYATKGQRYPLLIDPQLQAIRWIKKTFEGNQLKIIKFSNKNLQNELKASLQFGYIVLIPDVEETLDPILDPILSKFVNRTPDGRVLMRFGDADLDFDDHFKLFITTKIPNPHYLPEIFIKINIINFTVTFAGLEDQLLADVVKNERRETEELRDQVVVNLANNIREIKEIEKKILILLEESKMKKDQKIVDDVELIQTLEISKMTSEEISIKIEESTKIEKEIEEIRNQYRCVSIRGSILYFVIKDLAMIDPMYQYSLQYIQRLFIQAMQSTHTDVPEKRLENLIDKITKVIFTNVTRGLFEQHKMIFSFLIAIGIEKQLGVIPEALWSAFIRGVGVFDKSSIQKNPGPQLINQITWEFINFLSLTFEQFKGLEEHFTKNLQQWTQYSSYEDILKQHMPKPYEDKLTNFEKLIILKIIRSEKIMFGLNRHIEKVLGQFYIESPSVSMNSIYQDSDLKTPIIFVLQQGADPTNQILNFAKDFNEENNLAIISLGQGQGKVAEVLIDDAQKKGKWVLLQNCHLAKTWMQTLEFKVEEMRENSQNIHDNFRLFLTSMPADYFPVSVLQNGIKLTTEPPRGIKANLQRCFHEITDEYLSQCNKKSQFNKLLWGLCYFHTILQERKKFGPLGWNIKYEFNDSDLETSKQVLKNLLNEQSEDISYDALQFLTGQINYGGRVTDDWDRRCLMSILKKFYNYEILEDKYTFSASHTYIVPPVGNVDGYLEYISQLPIEDDPMVFGMHKNANLNYQIQESDKILNTILSIQPRESSTSNVEGAKTSDQIIYDLCTSILEQLPENINRFPDNKDINKELFVKNELGVIPSLSTVLQQEIDRFNILLTTMKNSLNQLKQAIQGLIIMNDDLDSMFSKLINNQIPKLWQDVAYPSLKPLGSWITDLQERIQFMAEWLKNGNPICYWMSGFFFPQGFLTGVLQTKARKEKIPIDKLNFSFKFLEQYQDAVTMMPLEGIYIYGLFLEGASWDLKKKTLIDQAHRELYFIMPVLQLTPIENYVPDTLIYKCPVYKTSERVGVLSTTGQSTNFILAIDVPNQDEDQDYWIQRGTALITQLNQ